jgi:hypothetical protein
MSLKKTLDGIHDDRPEVLDVLKEFNEDYFVIANYGGHCVRGKLAPDPNFPRIKTPVLQTMDMYNFGLCYMNDFVRVGGTEDDPELKTKSDIWLHHPLRRQYQEVLFMPGRDLGADYLNLWRGFAYPPIKGDCSLYLEHLKENICQGNPTKYRYLISWMAYHVHHPGEQGQVAIVVYGLKGVGKNVFAEGFANLWGPHGMVVSSNQRVTGRFNKHLRSVCVLVCDEAFFAGSKSDERILKNLITGNTLTIEAKGVDAVTAPNLLRLIILSNDAHIIRASKDERRYLVMECGTAKRKDYAYFQAIDDQLKNGGYSALLYHLLKEVDLTDFNVREAPRTEELVKQMRQSQTGASAVWYECLVTGRIPGVVQKDNTVRLELTQLLDWAWKKRQEEWRWVKAWHLGHLFGQRDHGLNYRTEHLGPRGNQLRKLVIPTLKLARQDWDKQHFEGDWHNETKENWQAEEWESCESPNW